MVKIKFGLSPGRMRFPRSLAQRCALAAALASSIYSAFTNDFAVDLPDGVKAVWDVDQACRESTPTRERICVNGLWRWRPAEGASEGVPQSGWGYFKVPGSWPGVTDYMQKDSQTIYAHPIWRNLRIGGVKEAWYEREISVPSNWGGRRIALQLEYLNSYAEVYVDGLKAGEIRFPGGELDLSDACRPGAKHRLSLFVSALPLRGVMLSYSDSASAREVEGTVQRRGLCGDAYLVATPRGPRITDTTVETSVRQKEIRIGAAIEGAALNGRHQLRGLLARDGSRVREFSSPWFRESDLREGRFRFNVKWIPADLWDIHTPGRQFELQLRLVNGDGKELDAHWKQRFGFRELWIDGRDFYLNGTRLFLSAVPLDNAQIGAALATYDAARESLQRLKDIGINYVYTHNYGCEPGSHLGFNEILRAADDVGMLVGFSQPHFSHYDWQSPNAGQENGYARHASFYVRAAGNHPSVVFYVMSHNSTGYSEDMNPRMIDGVQSGRDSWALRNAERAERAEAIVANLDSSRIVYHHASGNLGPLHNSNFYPNFVPVQELDDWFEHWAAEGIKPAFTCEYGAPFSWDWTMYRGWFEGEREFGSARVPWEFCLAEWNAQFLGDRAYRISEAEKENLRWEARQFRAGKVWHRWDYPHAVGSTVFDERYPVFAKYITDNWRAFRAWGVSGVSPWEYGHFWKRRDGADRSRKDFKTDWDDLQRPGFSPDYIDQRYERMDIAFERADWEATPAAEALIRNNRPLLAYMAGKPGSFTAKDHNFTPGETVEKQVVIINNSRRPVRVDVNWSVNTPLPITGDFQESVNPGDQSRIPIRFQLPMSVSPGNYSISLNAAFDTGEVQLDEFSLHILPAFDGSFNLDQRIALFDPLGETARWLEDLGVQASHVAANVELSAHDILIVGKAALTVGGPAPDIRGVREGLKVILFEQTSDVLEKRFGFRVQEYGLRRLFPRVPDHPSLSGLRTENLRDWRGSATLLPSKLDYEMRPRYGPTVEWCGIPVTRVWRCGNRGNVASVLIEKPARGDFLTIVDGGYGLQYSPLMEYREGAGMVLLCQMDATGRSENDPAAERLKRNILRYVSNWKPAPRRRAVFAGDDEAKNFLESLGVDARSYDGRLAKDEVLVAGPGAEQFAANGSSAIQEFIQSGGRFLAIGFSQHEAEGLLPFRVGIKKAEHIASHFDPFEMDSLLAGIGPANVHNRDASELPLIQSGAAIVGDGVLAESAEGNVVFLQLPPWQFDNPGQLNLRRTFRQTSVLFNRLLANMGVSGATPFLERFYRPVEIEEDEPQPRWLEGFYLDQPIEWDDPYRFFRW